MIHQILVTAIAASILFVMAALAMAIGLILRGKIMRGGCGSASHSDDPDIGCDACSKKKLNLCDEEDDAGLAGPSFAGTLGRFSKKS